MATIDNLFGEHVSYDIVTWAKPVVAAIKSDRNLEPLFTDAHFLESLREIISCAYHLEFVEDSDPEADIGLYRLSKDYGQPAFSRVLTALETGSDPTGYIHAKTAAFKQAAA